MSLLRWISKSTAKLADELVRPEFSNGGREYHPAGEPTNSKTHDFIDPELGRAVPYGVYDIGTDEGRVSVGDNAGTSTFGGEAI